MLTTYTRSPMLLENYFLTFFFLINFW